MIIQGGQDEIVPPASVEKLVEKLKSQRNLDIEYRVLPDANHFFHDSLDELDRHLEDYIVKLLARSPAAALR
jgi:hypothetical protein